MLLEKTHFIYGCAILLEKNGLPVFNALDYNGAYYNKEADAVFALFKYFSDPTQKNKHIITIPFHRIVVGNYSKGVFKDKIVLVGPQYLSNSDDFLNTPFNKESADVSKLGIHAQIIQALISENTIYQIPKSITNVLAIIISIILSLLISRIRPTSGLIITVGSLVMVILASYLLFVFGGLWLYFSQLILSIFIVYYIWVPFRAIAEYQSRYAIEEEAKILKEVDHLKHNFISFMSHDLKTPVAKIAGIVDILLTQYDTKGEQKIHLERILASTQELDKFITSILDLTKIESKNIKLSKSSKDINKIIKDVVKTLQFELNVKKMSMDLQLAPIYPIQLDLDLTKRVISNLVENAIKYSGEGKSISIKTWDDADWVYVEISDNGIGVKESDLVHIFEKFYRVKNDDSHKIKGSGLGLYLVKYFVELHEGKITAKSEVGKGTTFEIKFKNQG
ncbi:MAG: ATP-binding protein [Bacteriovoracaceae bacterium]